MFAIFFPQGNGTSGNFDLMTSYEDVPGKNVQVRIGVEQTEGSSSTEQFYTLDEGMSRPNGKILYERVNIPFNKPLLYQVVVTLFVDGVLSQYNQTNTFFPSGFTQAEFNAAVTANVNAVVANQVNSAVAAATAPLNAQILALQQAGSGNLQPLINAGLILQPQRRVGNYTIKDFTVLNAIYRSGALEHNAQQYFIKKDLDFINVQLLSIRQAVQKMYQVAVAKDNDLNMTAIYRTRQDKRKEYSAKVDTSFVDFLYESVRVMNYAVDEVRFNQKFNLLSPTLVRDLDILP